MKAGLKWGILLAIALGMSIQTGRTFGAVGCAQFMLFMDVDYGCYYASVCDGEPQTCANYDYGLLDRSPAYYENELPRECQASGAPQCDSVFGTGSISKSKTSNIATTVAPSTGVQQVVYYYCGNQCYYYTVCAATTPAVSPARAPAVNRDLPRHITRNVHLKQKRDENYMPRKNQQAPFAENINFSFPTYFSFQSLRKPGTTIYAKGFVVSTQKLSLKSKAYPGITAATGFEVQKKSEEYALVSAENVKLAPSTAASYIVKVKGVEYLIHTAE